MKMRNNRKYDLEERLINFSVLIIEIIELMQNSKASNHLAGQLIRSGTSPSLNYGEAQSAESRKDFIHKIKIILKELRETMVCLKIIKKARFLKNLNLLENAIHGNNELIAIFVRSIKTVLKNSLKQNS
jgi:four helix bundle protein